MGENFNFLKNPFEKIEKGNVAKFQDKCREIAKNLFNNYCIQCGEKKYYFAEIEFYYYEKGGKDGNWEEGWNRVTYARDGYSAGDLFYHLSGIDICFDSHYNEASARFGGILIRALKKEDGTVVAGPYTCRDEVLNSCNGSGMPRLSKLNEKRENETKVLPTIRCLGDKDTSLKLELCFYDGTIKKREWNPQNITFNTQKGGIVPKYGAYKTDRFQFSE